MSNKVRELAEQSATYDQQKHDHTANAHELHFNEQALLHVPAEYGLAVAPMAPTQNAWAQLFAKLAPTVYGRGSKRTLPNDYLLAIPEDLRAELMNRHMTDAKVRDWLVRGYGDSCRAILSHDYPCISNTELLTSIADLIDRDSGSLPDLKLVRPFLDADDLHMKIVFKDVNGGNYGIGCYIGNGETGNRRLRLHPLIQRHSCTNSIVLDNDQGIALVHRGSERAMMTQFKAALVQSLHLGAEVLDRVLQAEEERIPDFTTVLNGLSEKYGWSEDVADAVKIGTEGRQTRAGIVHGITYAAHTAINDPHAQIDMEVLGGRILVAPGTLFAQAARQSDPVAYNRSREDWTQYTRTH